MTKLPRWTARQLVKKLKKLGFVLIRSKGSHHFFRHPDGRVTVIPMHPGETLGPGLFAKILEDCELTSEDLQ